MTNWTISKRPKTQVKRAGELIGRGSGSMEEVASARAKISNFRIAHDYPLLSVSARARQGNLCVVGRQVARRLKEFRTREV